MGEIIGRSACPMCGEPDQVVKVNKNGNLYMFCDNRCSVRFSPKESRQITDVLRAGNIYEAKGLKIRPAVLKIEQKQTIGGENARRNTTNGRTNDRFTGGSGSTDGNTARKPTFAEWLWSDDDGLE